MTDGSYHARAEAHHWARARAYGAMGFGRKADAHRDRAAWHAARADHRRAQLRFGAPKRGRGDDDDDDDGAPKAKRQTDLPYGNPHDPEDPNPTAKRQNVQPNVFDYRDFDAGYGIPEYRHPNDPRYGDVTMKSGVCTTCGKKFEVKYTEWQYWNEWYCSRTCKENARAIDYNPD
jgi:hypothetical protein